MLLVGLGNMGWPRRAGFLGHRKVVEASLVDVGVEAMLRSAMALAVARRVLAMQLTMRCVAHMNFVPTESLAGTPKESEMESVMNDSYPWKRMWKANSLTPEATSRLESVPVQWDSVTSRRFLGAVLSCFVQTLMFSLRDTSGAKAALSGDLLREAELRPALHAAVAAGLRVDPLNVPTSIDQLAAQFESAIREYEGEFGALEPIGPKDREWIESPEPAGL